jgi:hypothetical protein
LSPNRDDNEANTANVALAVLPLNPDPFEDITPDLSTALAGGYTNFEFRKGSLYLIYTKASRVYIIDTSSL